MQYFEGMFDLSDKEYKTTIKRELKYWATPFTKIDLSFLDYDSEF